MMRRRALLLASLASPARAKEELVFPRDHGSHPASRLEWWYLTGILAGADGAARYGYQLTFFRLKGPAADDHPSRLAVRQILLAHAALSDLRAGSLQHDQRIARVGPGEVRASEADCDVRLRDWSLRRTPEGYRADFKFLSLRLKTTQPLLLQGQQGLSRKGPRPEQRSYYTSEVQLQTTARLAGGEETLQGRSWLDHEWSEQLLGSAGSDQAVGWDWLGINLLDGGALTVFQLRRADGGVLWAGGSWRRPDGSTRDFASHELKMRALRHWKSPGSAASYPLEWALHTPLGELRLKPLMDAQEIDARASTGIIYWEGAAELLSVEGQRLGLGYLELTGYAAPLRF